MSLVVILPGTLFPFIICVFLRAAIWLIRLNPGSVFLYLDFLQVQ